MPYTASFPKAVGTGLIISSSMPIPPESCAAMRRFIDEYEQTLSRFRADSLVARIGNAEHGGHFDFPDWAAPLFDLYDALFSATSGAIDPCVGEDLIRLGYDPALSFTVGPDAGERLGALHGRAVWSGDVVRSSDTTLVTHGPVHLDFGACGKGYLVDLLGRLMPGHHADPPTHPLPARSAKDARNPNIPSSEHQSSGHQRNADGNAPEDFIYSEHSSTQQCTEPEFVIDAGGDLLVHAAAPIRVALEDPEDEQRAVGVAEIVNGAFCASAPSRRHWEVAVNERTHLAIHHLLNAVDGLPVQQTEATWVHVPVESDSGQPDSDPADHAITGSVSRHHMELPAAHDLTTRRKPAAASRIASENGSTAVPRPMNQYPTMLADGLATALFVSNPNNLNRVFTFDCATLNIDRHAAISDRFPGHLF